MEIKIGQIWLDRSNEKQIIVEVREFDPENYPVAAYSINDRDIHWFTSDGHYLSDKSEHRSDLIKLISDTRMVV